MLVEFSVTGMVQHVWEKFSNLWSRTNNTVALTILTFWHIPCLHFMYAEVAWALVSSGTQVQLEVMLDLDYLPDYLSVSYCYVLTYNI